MAEIYSAPGLKADSRDKKSASVRWADVPTNFSPIDPDKKSAVLRQKTGWCAAAFIHWMKKKKDQMYRT